MTPSEFLEILKLAGRLKTTCRHCETEPGRRESTGEHSWRVALMAMLLGSEPEYQNVDMIRVLQMALIHDLGEAFTGDVPSFYKTSEAASKERDVFQRWIASFPEPQRREWQELFAEMEELKTPEAKIYKALDKLEAVLSHDESPADSWAPHEFFMQLAYGKKESQCSDFLANVKAELDAWTVKKTDEYLAAHPEDQKVRPILPDPKSEYVFRRCRPSETGEVFQIILDRMKWMDAVGIEHWNKCRYDELYPLSYYENAQRDGELFVLEQCEPREIVCACVLLDSDPRWADDAPALYVHNFASKPNAKGAGALCMLFIEDRAILLGKSYVRLDVLAESSRLFRYYEDQGFVPCGSCVDGWYRGALFEKDVRSKHSAEESR